MIRRLDHIGISVASMERAIAFYRDRFGMEVVAQEVFAGPLYEQILALEGATGRVALLRHGELRLELFEFERPSPRPSDPARPVCDYGITHFGIEVSGLPMMYERLKAAGVSFHCPPLDFGSTRATYARDPDGNVIELIELIR